MSADNRICIMRGEDERWYVWDGSMSTDYHQPNYSNPMGFFDSEEKAIAFANAESENYTILEGGVQIVSVDEQIRGLAYQIEDLSTRMRLLVTNGQQWETNFN